MSQFFRQFTHLLPNSRAWRLSKEKKLTEFFQGLTGIGTDVKEFSDDIWLDIFPETTRELELWENQFGLPQDPNLTIPERRSRIDGAWKARGGQGKDYLEGVFQAAGFPVYIHPWWDLPRTTPATVLDPFNYLNPGSAFLAACFGADNAQLGRGRMQFGAGSHVDLIIFTAQMNGTHAEFGDGGMQMGGIVPEPDGYALVNKFSPPVDYSLPTDDTKWPYFIYIGGETFPDMVQLSALRRAEFETLVLKLCPAHLWLGILVEWI